MPGFEGRAFDQEAAHLQSWPAWGRGPPRLPPLPQEALENRPQQSVSSVWWDEGGSCIGINEKLFQQEILEREGPGKVFQTDCMKSSVRQLDRCGFGGMRQDRHTAVCLSNVFSEERPGYVLSKVRGGLGGNPLEGLSPWALRGWGRGDVPPGQPRAAPGEWRGGSLPGDDPWRRS